MAASVAIESAVRNAARPPHLAPAFDLAQKLADIGMVQLDGKRPTIPSWVAIFHLARLCTQTNVHTIRDI